MLYKFASFKGTSPQFPCDDEQLAKLNALIDASYYVPNAVRCNCFEPHANGT
jgi:hypothetical protein